MRDSAIVQLYVSTVDARSRGAFELFSIASIGVSSWGSGESEVIGLTGRWCRGFCDEIRSSDVVEIAGHFQASHCRNLTLASFSQPQPKH